MADPAVVDLRIIQGSHWSKPFRLLADTELLDTTGYTAAFTVRESVEATGVELTGSTSDARVEVGYDPPKRTNLTAYGVGQQIVPAALNGYVYECTVAGTSGAAPPVYSTTLAATFTDGSVTWRVESTDAVVSNLRIALTPTDTTPLANFGLAVWDLELTDTFGHVTRIMEGSAVLSREINR